MPASSSPVSTASPNLVTHVVATAFDPHYFRQGLNLIASLHRTSLDIVDQILVYSVGLTLEQRTCLCSLERVQVLDFPAITHTFYEEYLHPKSHAYKCAAIKFSADLVAEHGCVLWMDAGIAALQPIGEIFEIIAQEDIFFVDHNDSGFWPFYNLMFSHPRSLELMGATPQEMLGPHLCSCLLGYKKNGRYQALIDEAYRYSQTREIVMWPKHRGAEDDVTPLLNRRERLLKNTLERAPALASFVSKERLRHLFGYYGHNGDQPIYSLLGARYGAPQYPAQRYNRSHALSHEASKKNWHSGAESNEILRSRYHLDKVDDEVVILHHRGTYDNLDGLRLAASQGRSIVILGNEPPASTDFQQLDAFDSIGIDDGFEQWRTADWYPTYYCCLEDSVLTASGEEIARLIADQPHNNIRFFLLRRSILTTHPQLATHPSVLFLEDYQANTSLLQGWPVTSVPFAARFALALGYRNLYVWGDTTAPAWNDIRELLNAFPTHLTHINDLAKTPPAVPDLPSSTYAAEVVYWRNHILDDLPLTPKYKRRHQARFNEHRFLLHLLQSAEIEQPVMVDVGAHIGNSLKPFAQAGWRVLAFEPDPANRQRLEEAVQHFSAVTVDARAVGEHAATQVPFFASTESTGNSSLLSFTPNHSPRGNVDVTSLTIALHEHGITHVDFLKIDSEGYDLMVLRGFPWAQMRPFAVLCEFEDRKTRQLGYTYHDMASFLFDQGYTVLVSEWHPILRYGTAHDWHALKRYPCVLNDPDAWGNIIAMRAMPDSKEVRSIVNQYIYTAPSLPSYPKRLMRRGKRLLRRFRS